MRKQVLLQVLRGTADANIRFEDLRMLLIALGFAERVKGSHHNLHKTGVHGNSEPTAEKFVRKAISGQTS